ncbi:MAG: hypothetical protein R3C68_03305 [Myxococcota bacterium]
MNYRQAYRDWMNRERYGIFHHALVYADGGASTGVHSVSSLWNHTDVGNAAHEFGHSLGLGHAGPYGGESIDANCKPTYPSIMNYAYLHAECPTDNNGRRIECRHFSDGYGRPLLNNTRLQEQGAVAFPTTAKGQQYIENLQRVFAYNVDASTGNVDWNRDGVFSPGFVPAYSNENGDGCEFTRKNNVNLSVASSPKSPALVRLGDRTYAFYVSRTGYLAYLETQSDFDCPTAEVGCAGTSFTPSFFDTGWNHDIQSFDAVSIVEDGREKVMIVYLDTRARLWMTKMSFSRSMGRIFSAPEQIPANNVAGEPSLTANALGNDDTKVVWLAYKNIAGFVETDFWSSAGGWAGGRIAVDSNGDLLPHMPAASSPAIMEVLHPRSTGLGISYERQLFGAFADSHEDRNYDGLIRLWEYSHTTRTWFRSDLMSTSTHTSRGRPALEWVPFPANQGLEGRIYLAFANQERTVRMRSTVVRLGPNATRTVSLGFEVDFDNPWHTANAIDLFFEPGVDTNLRYMRAQWAGGPDKSTFGNLEFRPKADGIVDYDLRNFSDWEVMAVDICRTVVNPGGTVINPIKCPAWRW